MKDRSEIGIVAATTRYEAWLAERIPLVKPDLELKHHAMSAGIFPFLRATFYRWAARWRALVGDVAAAPSVLAVGDLHIENFGTWRDAEGRLIWGVNDFDEAHRRDSSFRATNGEIVTVSEMDKKRRIHLKDGCIETRSG